MQKLLLFLLLSFGLSSCWQDFSSKKATVSFFFTEDFNKTILPKFTISDLIRALEQEGLQKNRDYYFAYSHASADEKSVKNVAEYVVQNVDLVVVFGDQGSKSVANLHKGQRFKTFMIARSIPESYDSLSMTGIFIKNKVSAGELEKTIISNLVKFIKKQGSQELPAVHF